MFGTSGVRGRFGTDVTTETALSLGRAVASTGNPRVVVGRDARTSGATLVDAVCAGVTECGGDVVDLGIVATPTVARCVGWEDADVGVVVTASHNPPEDNGLKLWRADGRAFGDRRRAEIEEAIETEAYSIASWDDTGTRREGRGRAIDRHMERLRSALAVDETDSHESTRPVPQTGEPGGGESRPSVVVDVGNGTGRLTADVLSEAGWAVETLNGQRDGRFPGRPSEPTAETCSSLRTLVAETDAQFGIAHDGDADRCMAVDDDGRFVPGDTLLALFASDVATEGDVVTAPLNTSLAVDDALAAVGASLVRTRVGDVHVAERAAEIGAVFAGEPSGAWIWPDETPCPDGPFAACTLARIVAAGGPLSEMVDAIPTYPLLRDSVEMGNGSAVVDAVERRLSGRYEDVETFDGVRVVTDDGWFLVRASGTQPLVRLTAEGDTEAATRTLLDTAREAVLAEA